MSFKVDFTNVEVKDFDPLPRGMYLVAVTDFDIGEVANGENKGQPKIQFEYTVQEPVQIGEQKTEGRKLWCNFFPTMPKTLFMMKGFCAGLGDDVDGEFDFDPEEILARDYEDRLLVAVVAIQAERKDKADPSKVYPARNEIKGFKTRAAWDPSKAAKGGAVKTAAAKSLLP